MFVAVLLLLATLAQEFTAAFEAGDVPRLMQMWSADSPTLAADRRRLTKLVLDRVDVRAVAIASGSSVQFQLRDRRTDALLEEYTLALRDGRVWTLFSIDAQPDTLPFVRELLHRAGELLDSGEIDQAFATYTRAAESADRLNDAWTRAAAQRGLGEVASHRGDGEAAVRHFERSLAIARGADDRRNIVKTLNRYAAHANIVGENARAEERWTEAVRLAREAGDPTLEARALSGLGILRSVQSDFKGARAFFDQVLRIHESLNDALGASSALNNIGVDERLQGRYPEALDHFRRSLELSRSIDDRVGVAYALANIGNVLNIQRRFVEALQAFQEALSIGEQLGLTDSVAHINNSIADLYLAFGNYEQSRAYSERALALAESIGFKEAMATALHNLAQVWLEEGNARRALELYAKALAIDIELGDRSSIALDHFNMARAHEHAGDRAAARRSYANSFTVAEEIDARETMVIALEAQALLTDDADAAIALARRTVAMAAELDLPERMWSVHTTLANAYRRAGRLPEAREEAARAVHVVEEIRRGLPGEELAQQAFARLIGAYHEMVAILVEQGDVAAAFEHAERAKGRVLLDVLRDGRPDVASVITEAERAREAELAANVAAVNREYRDALDAGKRDAKLSAKLRKARLDYDAFLTTLYAAHPQLRMERGEITPVRASEVGMLLARSGADALVEYVITDERTYVFSATPQRGLRVQTLAITRQKIDEEVRRFRALLTARDLTYGAPARALYDRLLKPVAAELRGAKTICIVADGPLWELPFQALQPGATEFVLDRHAVFYAPSLTVLREMSSRPREARAERFLAVGNPVTSLAALPQTETEIRRIAALYGAHNSRVHLRGEATEEVVKKEAPAFDVLHFATHGVLDDRNALYSRLVLSSPPSSKEDGLLEAREILRLDLRANLAVLSACETARGRVGAGEGLIGMSWAFFVAGVPTSVVSQWKVDSTSTTELMIELHRGLRSGNRSTAEALRRAALQVRADARYRHPFYWAPFVVVGVAR